jgi:short-subunit dehydrogenase
VSFGGSVVYITGASAGIGRDLALQLAAEGAKLALFARRRDLLDALVREIEAKGGTAHAYPLDVTSRDESLAAMARAATEVGPCDVLIANAGVSYPIKAEAFDSAKAEALMRVNIFGVLYAIEAVLPHMLQTKRGHIVGISSLASLKSFPFSHAYCASKAALNAQLEGLRLELRPHGIAVTTILPGFIRTDMTARLGHPMPMLMDCDKAARRILRAIRRRRKFYPFPWPMYLLGRISQLLPDALLARLDYE